MIERSEVVEAYGIDAMNKIASDLGVQKFNEKNRSGLCPFHSEKTPSFKYDKKTNSFHCFGCGARVDIVSHTIDYENLSYIQAIEKLCEELGIDSRLEKFDNSQVKRKDEIEYSKPETKTKPISDDMVKAAAERGINKNTLEFWRVKSIVTGFKKKGEYVKRKAYAFEVYDEYNELVNIAYRTKDKLFKQEKDCKLIMYGAWHVNINKPLILTEGQFDAMAVWQSGITNVVSIPAGATNRKYLEVNYDFLKQFPELIFWIDNDNPGRLAGNNLRERFPEARIVIHKECKDANETLVKFGEKEIKRFLNELPPLPKGVKDISEAHYNVDEPSEDERIETGFTDFDKHVKDLRMQQLTVIFGRDNEGKSTFISQLVSHQMYRGLKTFLNSAELGDQGIQEWLYKQMVDGDLKCYHHKKGKYGTVHSLKDSVLKAIREYTKNKLFIIDPTDTEIISDNDVLFKRMSLLATKFGVKLFILDNLQAILTTKFSDLNRDQSYFMERCRQFAKTYNCHVMVVAHPHKVEELKADENTKIGNLTKDNVSGSKDITNKAHNVISIERNFNPDRDFDMIMTNLKNKVNSLRYGFKYLFDIETLNYYNDNMVKVSSEDTWKKFLVGVDLNTYEPLEISESYKKSIEIEDGSPF